MRLFALLLLVSFLSCSDNKDSGPISYSGIYQTKKLENKNTGDKYRYFLKFYKDGTVISVTANGTADDLKSWFKKGHENVGEGQYEIEDDEITFTTSSTYGEIDYSGTIEDKNTLKLKSVSSGNGHKEQLSFTLAEE
jgi:hypothetical protein